MNFTFVELELLAGADGVDMSVELAPMEARTFRPESALRQVGGRRARLERLMRVSACDSCTS